MNFKQLVDICDNQNNIQKNTQNEQSTNKVQVNNNLNTKNQENQIRDQQQKIDELVKQINKIQESKKKKKQKINERDQKINQLHAENQKLQETINSQQLIINGLKQLLENTGIGQTQILELNVDLMQDSMNTLTLKSFSKLDKFDMVDKFARSKIVLEKINNIKINLEQYIQNIEKIIGNPASLRSVFSSEQYTSQQTHKKIIIQEISNPEFYFQNRNSIQNSEYSLIRFSDTQ